MTDSRQAPFLFGDENETPAAEPAMSDATRARVRQSFAELGITTAREQFAMVAELTGQKVASVAEMTQKQALSLLLGLSRRIESARTSSKQGTGNAWVDRDEDTWIDKL
jgi:DNA polymerase-3 subunit epsilon